LIFKGYWEGLNSHPSQETQNANLPIGDVMITRLIDFDIVGNVGHMDGDNIGGAKVSPSHQKPQKELTNLLPIPNVKCKIPNICI
jgi:hypothetical protein